MPQQTLTLNEAAEIAGVSPATLRRWLRSGLIPQMKGRRQAAWTSEAASHARLVARLRERGHRLDDIRAATEEGRLASHRIEQLFPEVHGDRTVDDAAELTGLEPALIERFWVSLGLPTQGLETMTEEDLQALQYAASMLSTGFPLVAFLQLARVYGQALRQIADAEVRLFHLYVHEPLMREGIPGIEMAEQMEHLARDLLPMASPLMDFVHQRFLQHYIEQDVVGHMEIDREEGEDLGRVRVAIAFCDLAGYTRYTEEQGEDEAVSFVERFVEKVGDTLPDDARVIKTIGDEVMIVGQDAQAITDWAVGFQQLFDDRPEPRVGIHYGATLYRDGDYFGREVNTASRVVARARGGEVLVTDAVVERVSQSDNLAFENVGQVKLKGFDDPRQLFRAAPPPED
ncbi:MAG TPA: MerR family transcriptional regulator [Thermoleophilaceae bacterium]|nr:MerR family transcriptional regulator [Thermoleophilaceae bacterium]